MPLALQVVVQVSFSYLSTVAFALSSTCHTRR